MKQIALSVLLMIALFTAGIVNMHMADNRLEDIVELFGMAQGHADRGDWDTAGQLASKAMEKWSESQTYLSIITRHSELDDINATANRVVEALRCRDYTLFSSENRVLIGMIEHICQMEQLNVENIL